MTTFKKNEPAWEMTTRLPAFEKNEPEWGTRHIVLKDKKGNIAEEFDAEFPTHWTDMSCKVVADKYFRIVTLDNGERQKERSLKSVVHRIAHTITEWGKRDGYFQSHEEASDFYRSLYFIMVWQYACFNSPVLFNVGVQDNPQTSACFINPVGDSMESIADWYSTSMLVYKGGSGLGTNVSGLRASNESLSVGGKSSGPISFIKSEDSIAGSIKSGGASRRAATITIMDMDHPDIEDFIDMKAHEEKKAHALLAAGYSGGIEGEAYSTVAFQNMNVSTRATDAFMLAAKESRSWDLIERVSKKVARTVNARDLLMRCAERTHECGDPGIQFHDTVNRWNTCKASGVLRASNPCAEYIFDLYEGWGACNLASINLLKFYNIGFEYSFDWPQFETVVRVMITAMDILIDRSGWPHPKLGEAARAFRPLGLGYSNLASLFMINLLPYASEAAQEMASTITRNMTKYAYKASIELARRKGAFDHFDENDESFREVLTAHGIDVQELIQADGTMGYWGIRNAQTTLLAPTGTISFFMGCDSYGMEPFFSLVTWKEFIGGTIEKIPISIVDIALSRLCVTSLSDVPENRRDIFRTASFDPDLPQFPALEPLDHIHMMEAVQPFISGAISKTVNLPNSATVQDIFDTYLCAWELGLKSITVYRDGSKIFQPLSSTEQRNNGIRKLDAAAIFNAFESCDPSERGLFVERFSEIMPLYPRRRKLPSNRMSTTHSFQIGDFKGTLHIGFYPDTKKVGEVFVTASKSGTTINGLLDCFAICFSYALQYGVPLSVLTRKFSFQRFEPDGWTSNPSISHAHSIVDYIARMLDSEYNDAKAEDREWLFTPCQQSSSAAPVPVKDTYGDVKHVQDFDAPPCAKCGTNMRRVGACHTCMNCGDSSGCG